MRVELRLARQEALLKGSPETSPVFQTQAEAPPTGPRRCQPPALESSGPVTAETPLGVLFNRIDHNRFLSGCAPSRQLHDHNRRQHQHNPQRLHGA